LSRDAQLRSAFATFLLPEAIVELLVLVSADIVDEPLAPMFEELPLLVVLLAVLLVVPPGVPVLPIGVLCELCCPAPTAGSLAAVFGGVLCAIAAPATATATPARTALRDAVMIRGLLGLDLEIAGRIASEPRVDFEKNYLRQFAPSIVVRRYLPSWIGR